MTVYRHWVDFITYPLQPGRVRSREQRLDTRDAVASALAPQFLHDVDQAFVISMDDVAHGFEKFEAMQIDDYGDVTIWCSENVHRLNRWHGMEKMIFLPRNPPMDK